MSLENSLKLSESGRLFFIFNKNDRLCVSVHLSSVSFGPYLPCRENIKLMGAKNNIRPPRPELNMCLLPSLVESSKVRLFDADGLRGFFKRFLSGCCQ